MKLTIEQYFVKKNAFSFFKKLIKKKVIVAKTINFVEMSLNFDKNSSLFLKNTMKREFRQARERKKKTFLSTTVKKIQRSKKANRTRKLTVKTLTRTTKKKSK